MTKPPEDVTVECPDCGHVVGFEVLIASRDGGFDAHYYSPPERS